MKRVLALVLAGIVLAALLALAGGATTSDVDTDTNQIVLVGDPGAPNAPAGIAIDQVEPEDVAEGWAADGDMVLLCFTEHPRRTDAAVNYLSEDPNSDAKQLMRAEAQAYNRKDTRLLWRNDQGGPQHRWLRG